LITNLLAKRQTARPAENCCIATFSVAIRRLQGRVFHCANTHCPLTLDCKYAPSLRLGTFCTQDTLSRRRYLLRFQRTDPRVVLARGEGRESYWDSQPSSRVGVGGA